MTVDELIEELCHIRDHEYGGEWNTTIEWIESDSATRIVTASLEGMADPDDAYDLGHDSGWREGVADVYGSILPGLLALQGMDLGIVASSTIDRLIKDLDAA